MLALFPGGKEKLLKVSKAAPCVCIIGIPGLLHCREFMFESTDQRQNANAIATHGEKDTTTPVSSDHECGPVTNHAPDGHSCWMIHNIAIQFSSLNALDASMSRNSHSSSSSCCFHSSSVAWVPPYTFDAGFWASTEWHSQLLGLAACGKKSSLCGKPPPGFANSNGVYAEVNNSRGVEPYVE
jgi:hypothetical protein